MIKVLSTGRAVVLSLLWNVCVYAAASESAPVDEFAKKMEAATKALASTQAVIGDQEKQEAPTSPAVHEVESKVEKQAVKSSLSETAAKLDELNKALSTTMASGGVSQEEVVAPSKAAMTPAVDQARFTAVENDVAVLQKQITSLTARVDLLEKSKSASVEAESPARSHWSFSTLRYAFSEAVSLLHHWIVEPVQHLIARIGTKKN